MRNANKPDRTGKAARRIPSKVARKIFSWWRLGYFSTIGFVGNLFFGTSPPRNPFSNDDAASGPVAVLGRGRSTELFIKVTSEKTFSAVILCNFENRDLLSQTLRRAISKAPHVVVLSNSTEPAPSFGMAKAVGVNWVVHLRKKGELRRRRTVWRLNRLGMRVHPLPEALPESLHRRAEGTGALGVALASLISQQVEVFGIEFYKTDYLVGSFEKIAPETGEVVSLREASARLQRSFELVAKHQVDVHFTMHCFADHSITQENVTLLKSPISEKDHR